MGVGTTTTGRIRRQAAALSVRQEPEVRGSTSNATQTRAARHRYRT